jgi:hypothetical protein
LAEEKDRNKNLEKHGNSKRKIDTTLTLEEVDINQVIISLIIALQILKVFKSGNHHIDCLGRRQKNQRKTKHLKEKT